MTRAEPHRFRIVTPVATIDLFAASPRAALDSSLAHWAPLSSMLLDASGAVLATRERVCIGGVWLTSWLPTSAWEDDAPMGVSDIREAIADEAPSSPVLVAVWGGRR